MCTAKLTVRAARAVPLRGPPSCTVSAMFLCVMLDVRDATSDLSILVFMLTGVSVVWCPDARVRESCVVRRVLCVHGGSSGAG